MSTTCGSWVPRLTVDATVGEAAKAMADSGVGAALVVDPVGVVGVVTADGVAEGVTAPERPLLDFMAFEVVRIDPADDWVATVRRYQDAAARSAARRHVSDRAYLPSRGPPGSEHDPLVRRSDEELHDDDLRDHRDREHQGVGAAHPRVARRCARWRTRARPVASRRRRACRPYRRVAAQARAVGERHERRRTARHDDAGGRELEPVPGADRVGERRARRRARRRRGTSGSRAGAAPGWRRAGSAR